MRKSLAFADRTAVLFLGVAAGVAIGYAFGSSGEGEHAVPPLVPAPAASVAPPPPTVPDASATTADARDKPAGTPTQAPPPATVPAATAPEPAAPYSGPLQSRLVETLAAGQPVRVGVFGDSFGDGVWSALYRLLPARDRYKVIKYSQQSTGFTRYASLNLEEHTRAQLAADGPVDVAVISFGANDTQGVYANGHAARLMSPEWQRIIGERIDRFVALLRSRGAAVYWVGLPKMRKADFDANIAAMNAFYAARMQALGVPFIDTKPFTVDASGAYAAYLPDPLTHEQRLMRANDGVHMSMNGYIIITRGLASRIRAYVDAARARAGVPAPLPAAPPAPRPVAPPPAPPRPARTEPRPAPAPEPVVVKAKPAEAKPVEIRARPVEPKLPEPHPADTRATEVRPPEAKAKARPVPDSPAPRRRLDLQLPAVPDDEVGASPKSSGDGR